MTIGLTNFRMLQVNQLCKIDDLGGILSCGSDNKMFVLYIVGFV